MKREAIILTFVVVCVTIFVVAYFAGSNQVHIDRTPSDTPILALSLPVEVEHSVNGNDHLLSGYLLMKNPCYQVDDNVLISEGEPEAVSVVFTSSLISDHCIDVPTREPFSISFEADTDARMQFLFNGDVIPFNLRLVEDEIPSHIRYRFSSSDACISFGEGVNPCPAAWDYFELDPTSCGCQIGNSDYFGAQQLAKGDECLMEDAYFCLEEWESFVNEGVCGCRLSTATSSVNIDGFED